MAFSLLGFWGQMRWFWVILGAFAVILGGFSMPAVAQSASKSPNWHTNARLAAPSQDAPRGWVQITSAKVVSVQSTGERSARTLQITPGFRLYDAQGRIVPIAPHVGQGFAAAWSVEKATGKLHAIWVLNGQ